MLRLSALASSVVLDADALGKIEGKDGCGGGVTTDPTLVAEFWMGRPPEAVCWRRRSAVKSEKIFAFYVAYFQLSFAQNIHCTV